MVIEEYLRMRIQSAESILAGERLAGNVPKAMAEKAAIGELRGVEAFLNNSSEKGEAELPASDNNESDAICPYYKKGFTCALPNVVICCGNQPCSVIPGDKRAYVSDH